MKFIILIFQAFLISLSQVNANNSKGDSTCNYLLNDKNIAFIFSYDNAFYYIKWKVGQNSANIAYLQNSGFQTFDSITLSSQEFIIPRINSSKIIMNGNTQGDFRSVLKEIDLKTGKLCYADTIKYEFFNIYKEKFLCGDWKLDNENKPENFSKNLYLFDPVSNNYSLFTKLLDSRFLDLGINQVALSSKFALILTGIIEKGDYVLTDKQLYLYDLVNNQLKSIANKNDTIHNAYCCFFDQNYIMDPGCKYFFSLNGYCFNEQFDIIGKCLSRNFSRNDIIGWKVISSEIQNYFILSTLDIYANYESSKVIIPVKIQYETEKALYNIYSNQVLNWYDISSIGKCELNILLKMIFAKHNQKFDDEYYQAYFNTFVFYSDESMRKSRRSDVSSLLTETDNKNLEIINMQLLKYK